MGYFCGGQERSVKILLQSVRACVYDAEDYGCAYQGRGSAAPVWHADLSDKRVFPQSGTAGGEAADRSGLLRPAFGVCIALYADYGGGD